MAFIKEEPENMRISEPPVKREDVEKQTGWLSNVNSVICFFKLFNCSLN